MVAQITNDHREYKSPLFAFSYELPQENGERGVVPLGLSHYSYAIVKDRFCNLLENFNVPWLSLRNPETVKEWNIKYTKLRELNSPPIHISFKPPQYLRPIRGLKNIAHIAWEFNKLPDPLAKRPWSPINDDVKILNNFDQIWVGCDFTRDVLEKEGVKNIHVVPAPIRVPPGHRGGKPGDSLARLQRTRQFSVMCSSLSSRNHNFSFAPQPSPAPVSALHLLANVRRSPTGKAFLAVMNPHDWRKNTAKIIRAFSALHQDRPDTVLILKFTYDPDLHPNLLNHIMSESHMFDAKGVFVTSDFIPDIHLNDFISCFDFYLCASRAEGQNLPLLEAMAAGVVPVSVANTAMADYIDDDAGFAIPSFRQTIAPPDHPAEIFWGMEWHETRETDILDALHRAMNAGEPEIDRKREKALTRIKDRYSFEAVASTMNDAFRSL